jgi:CheY-like chemotaxis protein
MSLVGNLEDLGLGEILQIVSLSRKSGVLTLESLGREGKVTFLEGQVIRATTASSKINLGDMLVKHNLVDLETLKKALFIQRNSDNPPRLGEILSEKFGGSPDKIEEVAKEQIEKIVYGFFAWNEGTFSFELGEPSELASGSVNPLQLMLDQGLNPQWLAMEGSRILDEKMHRGETVEEEEEESIVDLVELLGEELAGEIIAEEKPSSPTDAVDDTPGDEAAASVEITGPPLFLVDDDQLTAQVLARQLRELNLDVNVFTSPNDYLKGVDTAVAEGQEPLLLIDLVMPKLDGTGISGGVEVARTLKGRYPDLVLMLMSDQITPELETKLVPLKLSALVMKPKKSQLSDPKGKQILADLIMKVGQFVDPAAAGTTQTSVSGEPVGINFGAELLKEVDDAELQAKPSRIEPTPGIHLLGGMLQELNNPALGGGIILLVLRFASELMNRAVIFFVKGEEVVGLGQFGLDLSGNADDLVRQIKVPAGVDSVFKKAIAEFTPKHTVFSDSEWDRYLVDQLGGQHPEEIFIGPIISEGNVVAIIYGDNLPEKKKVGDTESFEIFLSQAGMAMERALLERRLKGGQAV